MDYSKLVKSLRICVNGTTCVGCIKNADGTDYGCKPLGDIELVREAADAIEELEKKMADEYIKRTLAKAEFTGNFRDEYPTALIHALIDSVPAADVAPVRHGWWIKCTSTYCMCSECKRYWIPIDDQYDYHYCPNCGAKMDCESDG